MYNFNTGKETFVPSSPSFGTMVSRFLGVGQQPSPPKKKQGERGSIKLRLKRLSRRLRGVQFFLLNFVLTRRLTRRTREKRRIISGSLSFSLRGDRGEGGGSSSEDRPISINRDRRRRRGRRESNLRDHPRKVTSQLAPCHPVRPFHPLWLTSICHTPATRARHLPFASIYS